MVQYREACVACFVLLVFLSPSGGGETVAQEPPGAGEIDGVAIEAGSGSFVVQGGGGHEEKRITVFYHRPESLHPESAVLMVIPGAGRNGDEYRDAWVSASERYGVLVLSPSYPERFYPEFWSYNLAGMPREVTLDLSVVVEPNPEEWTFDDAREELESTIGMHELVGNSAGHQLLYQLILLSKAGMISGVDVEGTSSVAGTDSAEWIFGDFDRIFEEVRDHLGLETETYDLFGHSAGGQILHRLALFRPNGRADRVVAANSGWYTLPTFEQEFPYGLEDSGLAEDQLEAAFGTRLVVFLGEEDDEDETRGSLRRTPEADQQGEHRLERGRYFFSRARETAEALGMDFEWNLELVPDVGHDYERMSEAAAEYLYGRRPR